MRLSTACRSNRRRRRGGSYCWTSGLSIDSKKSACDFHQPEPFVEFLDYFFQRLGGIQDQEPFRLLFGEFQVAVADLPMEYAILLFDPVPVRSIPSPKPGHGRIYIAVEQDSPVGPQVFCRPFLDYPQALEVETAPESLVGKGGVNEPVGQDPRAFLHSGNDDLIGQLGPAGAVEEHFGAAAHLKGSRIKQDFADFFADSRSARLASPDERDSRPCEPVRQLVHEGTFPAPVNPLETDELCRERKPVVFGLIQPGSGHANLS